MSSTIASAGRTHRARTGLAGASSVGARMESGGRAARGRRGLAGALRPCLLTDDLRPERAQDAEELALLFGRNTELVERLHQILDQRVEIGIGDAHALVRRPHVPAGIDARAPGRGADLV